MNHGKELLWQGKNISVYNTLTKKKVPKNKEKHDLLPVFEMFSCLRVDTISQEGRDTELGVGRSHRVPSADQGQVWDKNLTLGRKRGSRRREGKTEAGRESVDPGPSRGLWDSSHHQDCGLCLVFPSEERCSKL